MRPSLTKDETEAWVSMVISTDKLIGLIDSELKKRGLPPYSWYDVLLELDKCDDGRLRFVEIGKRVLLTRYNVTRTIARLENAGLVTREECNDDARGYFAVITKKGRNTRKKMWPVYYNVLKTYFFSAMNEKELKIFLQLIRKVRNTIEA